MGRSLARSLFFSAFPHWLRRYIPHYIYKHLWFEGRFRLRFQGKQIGFYHHSGTAVDNDIFWRDLDAGHEPISMRFWIEIIKRINPRIILDIGAHTGIYGITAKLIHPSSIVLFFEPAVGAKSAILKTLKENNILEGAFLYEVFLSSRSASNQILYSGTPKKLDYVYPSAQLGVEGIHFFRDIWKLSELLNLKHPEITTGSINLVKIDIEGHEFQALKGFENFLTKNTIFLIEILSNSSARKLAQLFPSNDYYFVNIDDIHGIIEVQDTISVSRQWNVLIIPKRTFAILQDLFY